MNLSFRCSVNLSQAEDVFSSSKHSRRQALLAQRAAFMMRKYVPMREGILRNSEPMSSNYEQGILAWSTPYARRQYSKPMNHTTPGSTDHWDQAMLREHGRDLAEFAAALYRS